MPSRRNAAIVANMVIFHIIVNSPTRSKRMTINQGTRRTMTRKITRRRGLSRRRKSKLSLGSGSPMVRPQATMMMMMTPTSLWGLLCMRMNHLYLHHPCASWLEVTPR